MFTCDREVWGVLYAGLRRNLCFGDISAVAEIEWEAMTWNAASILKGQFKEIGAKDGLEKTGDGKLEELHITIARDV